VGTITGWIFGPRNVHSYWNKPLIGPGNAALHNFWAWERRSQVFPPTLTTGSSWCHCHSLSLASVKSRLFVPFWYQLTQVFPDKGPLNGCCDILQRTSMECQQHNKTDCLACSRWTKTQVAVRCRHHRYVDECSWCPSADAPATKPVDDHAETTIFSYVGVAHIAELKSHQCQRSTKGCSSLPEMHSISLRECSVTC